MSADGWKHMPPDQPRVCERCGGRVNLKQSVCFITSDPPRTYHLECVGSIRKGEDITIKARNV